MTIEEAGNSSAEFEFSLPSRYTTPPQTSISGPVILHQSQEAYLTEPTRTEPNQIKLTLPKPNQSLYKIIPFPQGYAGWQYEYICNSGSPRKHYVLVCADCGSQGTIEVLFRLWLALGSVRWQSFWPLIGSERSADNHSGLWLADWQRLSGRGQVTIIVASDWLQKSWRMPLFYHDFAAFDCIIFQAKTTSNAFLINLSLSDWIVGNGIN